MRKLPLLLSLLLIACGQPEQASEPTPEATATEVVTATPSPIASASARDYTPPQLTPEAEKTEKGARNLLLAWALAMEDRAFGPAYLLFGEYAERTGQSSAQYAASFADYRTVNVAIGEGMADGACGSSYYEVPVTLTGTTQDGKTYVREGTITLRRVNDVDGATPAQLKWHLEKLEWDE
jgi:hypothetical protein